MKNRIAELVTIGMLTLMGSTPSIALAQERGGGGMIGGGGDITESDLRYYMGKMSRYLQTEEGRRTFPEIVAYDQQHPEQSFIQLLETISPVVENKVQKDAYGIERTCVSYLTPNRRFVCNSAALPDKTLDQQPSVYRIVFHELLVQAGIEKPLSEEIPSEYKISWRITENVHLETHQEWMPGRAKNTFFGVECNISEFRDYQNEKRRVLIQAYESSARLLISEMDKHDNFVTAEYPLNIRKTFINPDGSYRTFELALMDEETKVLDINIGIIIGTTSYIFGKFPEQNDSAVWRVNTFCEAKNFENENYKYFLSPSFEFLTSKQEQDKLLSRTLQWLKVMGD